MKKGHLGHFKWSTLFYVLVFLAIFLSISVFESRVSNKAYVVFCDVGQGDAAIFIHSNIQILIDAGPDRRVLACLDQEMPFWDKTIEVLIATHPDYDHVAGIPAVLSQYSVKKLYISDAGKNTDLLVEIRHLLENLPSDVYYSDVRAGDVLQVGPFQLKFLWPESVWFDNSVPESGSQSMSLDAFNYNLMSYVVWVTYGNFDVLINGDADMEVQDDMQRLNLIPIATELMTAPHHGSGTGILESWYDLINPQAVIISVGKNNRYGHPHPSVIRLLQERGTTIFRTDMSGTIRFVTDGQLWWRE